jgi:hypothetical protein
VTVGIRNFPRKALDTITRVVKTMKALRGRPDGFVGTNDAGVAETEQLGTGTASSTTYLRGDNTWATPPGAGTAGDVIADDVSTTAQNIVAYNTADGKHITELTGTQGDILYYDGTKWAKLGAGTSGQFLKTNGAGANPAWTSGAGGDVIADDLSTTTGSIVVYADGSGQHITEFAGTQGDIIYHNGTTWQKLAAGTDEQVLKTNGAGQNPAWDWRVTGDDTSTTDQNIVAYVGTNGRNVTELTGTQGDVLYHNGTKWAKLAAGTNGKVLRTNGSAANPSWDPIANVHVVPAGTQLQAFIDGLGVGATILLEKGTYYAVNATPTTPLTITSSHYQLKIIGMGQDYSKIASPVLVESGQIHMEHLWVYPPSATYCVKVFKSGSFLSRGSFNQVRLGADNAGSVDKPTTGLQLDGAGLLLAEQLLCAFCSGNGLLVDSTAAEPNTTLKFDMCSFVGNGAYGVKLMGSCTIAEFNGGNAEQNVSGEIYAEDMNNLRIVGFDFETNQVMGNQLECQNCSPVEVTGCNFVTASGKATRAILLAGSSGFTVDQNRFSGYGSVGVVRISETCLNARIGVNTIANSGATEGWLEDYSRP